MYNSPLLRDFRNFLYITWKFLGLPEPTDIQYDIAWYLQHGPKRSVIEAFRGVGKSYITSAFVPWCLLRNPNENILVVSASKDRAAHFSTFVQRLIHEMPELAYLKPRPGQRDSKVAFDVGPATAAQAPSVTSKGLTGQLTGSRAGIIIADDVEIPNNSMTQTMRSQLRERVKEFESILIPGGSIKFLGTPQTEDSLYNHLPDVGYDVRIWPARYPDPERIERYNNRLAPSILEKVEANPDLIGRTTEPNRFSDLDLAEREAHYGRSGFSLQFMLDTRLSDKERFPLKLSDLIVMDLDVDLGPEKVIYASSPELIINDVPNVGMSGDKFYRPMDYTKPFIPYTGSVMFVDPAGRGKDETAWAVVKILNSQLFVLDWGGIQGGYDEKVMKKLVEVAMANKVNLILVEANFGDGMFTQLLQPIVAKIYPVGIEEVKHYGKQKELRIIDVLEPVMNQHKLIINKKLIRQDYDSVLNYPIETQERYMGFYQMTRITKEKGSLLQDDRIDALAGAVGYWVEQGAMSRDIDKAIQEERERQLEADLERFLGSIGREIDNHNRWSPNLYSNF